MKMGMGAQWAIQIIFSVLIIGFIGTHSAFALPISVEYIDEEICDVLNGPQDLHELGIPPTLKGLNFPPDEEISASHVETDLTTCINDNPNTPNYIVTMTNKSPHDFIQVWYVADDFATVGNSDGQIDQLGIIGGPPGDSFKIDTVGVNRPLLTEDMTVDGIFEAGETWQFLVIDWKDLIFQVDSPSSFRSYNIGGASSPSGDDMSRASIIAFTEDQKLIGGTLIPIDATAVLIAGLSTNFSILTGLVVMGSVTFVALYYSAKKRNPENS